jgi:hypothetical protein
VTNYLFIPILLFGQACGHPPANHDNIARITVSYVGMDITSIFSIGCDKFEKSFGDEISTIEYSSADEWSELLAELNNCVNSTKQTDIDVDTRARIKLYDKKDKVIKTYCIGYNSFSVDGTTYLISSQLRDYLISKIFLLKTD